MPANPNCTACPLHEGTSRVCVYGSGPANAQIMLIGEAPGAEEERTGRPFQGEAGQKLTAALREAGIPRESVYITNVAKCRPPGNRTPKTDEVDACISYLIDEIETVQPKTILAMGGAALKALTGTDKVGAARGKLLSARRGLHFDAQIFGTFHPAASLYARGDASYRALVDDLTALRTADEPEERADIGQKFIFAPGASDEDILGALKLFKEVDILTVDLEWSAGDKGKNDMIWPWSKRGEVYSIAITSEVLPFDEQPTSVSLAWPPSPKVRRALSWLLSTKKCAYHNVMADGTWLTAEGFEDYHVEWDTMLLAYLIDETQSLSLANVAKKYAPDAVQTVGGGGWRWKGHLSTHRPRTSSEWDELLSYGADDTYGTLMALDGIREELARLPVQRRNQILRLHRHILLPATRVLQKASLRGVPIDEEQLAVELRSATARQMKAAEDLAEIASVTPKQAIALARSGDQTKAYMKGAYGIELNDTQKDNLAELLAYPAIGAILRIRKEEKILGTYLQPWQRLLQRQGDGRLHSIYSVGKVVTGRTSTVSEEGGALQVTPREKWVRRLVKAADGRKIVSADYSTVEMRIGAVVANDKTLLSFFKDGIDVHAATGAYIVACGELGRPPSLAEYWPIRGRWMDPILKEYHETGSSKPRQEAKGVNFGLLFNMAPPKLQVYMKTKFAVDKTLDEVVEIHKGYHQLYTGIKPWQRQMLNDAERLGYSETMFGRRRKIAHEDLNAAVNNPVQSPANDFNFLAMIAIDQAFIEEGLDAYIIGAIHDSIMVDASDEDAERAEQLMVWHMENVDTSRFGFKLPIPLPAESKVSQTWA